MDIKVFKRDNLDQDAWETLSRRGSYFHTCQWVDICLRGLWNSPEASFICGFEKGRLVAGLPAIVTNRLGQRSFLSMPFGTYGSAIFDSDVSGDLKKQFINSAIGSIYKRHFSLVEIVDFDGNMAAHDLSRLEKSEHFTHILDLDETGEYHPANNRVERHIRSGEKKETILREMDKIGRIEEFYRLYRMSEKRRGRSRALYDRSFFKSVFEIADRSKHLYWIEALHNGLMIGSQINFIHGDTLFYWQGIMDYDKREHKPAYLLMKNTIDKALEMGMKHINLGASPSGAIGLINYKESWGARKVEYQVYRFRSMLRRITGR